MRYLSKTPITWGYDFTGQPGMFSYKNTPAPNAAIRPNNPTVFAQLEQIEFT